MADDDSAFAPPEAPAPSVDLRRVRRFLLQRVLRVGANAAMFGLFATLVWRGTGWLSFAIAVGIAVVLWLPTSGVLFRIAFFPAPPDPRFVDGDGEPVSLDDIRWTTRAQVSEYLLGSVPMPLILGWMAMRLDGGTRVIALVAAVMFGALVGRRAVQALVSLVLNEVATDLALGAHTRARTTAEALARIPGRPRDHTLQLLARARFQTGDVTGALAALDRIRDVDGWGVGPLRAQMAIGHGSLDEAEALGANLRREDAGAGALIETLVDLHRGRAADVAGRADALMSTPCRPEVRRTLAVLVAAALVPADPARARALLAEHGWSRDRLDWLRTVWPPVGDALGLLDGW